MLVTGSKVCNRIRKENSIKMNRLGPTFISKKKTMQREWEGKKRLEGYVLKWKCDYFWMVDWMILLTSNRISAEAGLSEINIKKHILALQLCSPYMEVTLSAPLVPAAIQTVIWDLSLSTLLSLHEQSWNLLSSWFFTIRSFKHTNHKSHRSKKKRTSFSSSSRSPRGEPAWSVGPHPQLGQLRPDCRDWAGFLCSRESWFPKRRTIGR